MKALISTISYLDSAASSIIKAVIVVLSIIVAFAMVIGIVARTVLGVPVFGIEEIILMSAVWLYMLGAIMASRERSHLSADFVQTFVKNDAVSGAIQLLATGLSLVMAVFFIWWSYSLFSWGVQRGQVTPVFSIPLYVSQSSIFLASILLFLYALRDLVQDACKLFSKEA
ncbi:MAG: TRAP transporter small permease [Pseudomonadota bacterium]|uniref:TRAP transporter small permease n=1 Tax=Salinicola salarius TaxID=430457 RepID=UPI0026F2010D|nr:TRAP transporter small permease [Salinicola salarius]MED5499399.1 TRAP transporter small permease [Pseudomonadota bacterium]